MTIVHWVTHGSDLSGLDLSDPQLPKYIDIQFGHKDINWYNYEN